MNIQPLLIAAFFEDVYNYHTENKNVTREEFHNRNEAVLNRSFVWDMQYYEKVIKKG